MISYGGTSHGESLKKKGKEEKPDVRGKFSGRIGYVLAVAGSAVGLGNIWRFPYLAAKYGGGMFLLVYLILMLTFGYVMIMSETTLGRMTKKVRLVLLALSEKRNL